MKFLVDEAFGIKSDKSYIKLNKSSATWADKIPKKTKTTFLSKNDIMVWFTYLLDNIYIKYGQAIYRQIIGIPMGTDCAPELANLFYSRMSIGIYVIL